MAVPKQKTSKGRKNRRRSHLKATKVHTIKCKHCGKEKISHRVCKACGKY